MCLIAYADAAVLIENLMLLTEALKENPHGSGLVSRGGKTILNHDLGLKYYLKFSSGLTALHFRWATKGSKGQDNIHPFDLGDSFFFHNGTVTLNDIHRLCKTKDLRVFYSRVWGKSLKSDTKILSEILSGMTREEKHHTLHSLASHGSKFLLWEKATGEIHEFGQFYDLEGMRVSNFYSFPSLCYPIYDEYEEDSYNSYKGFKESSRSGWGTCKTPGCSSELFDNFGRCYFCWEYAAF